jgi:hypothetical protein
MFRDQSMSQEDIIKAGLTNFKKCVCVCAKTIQVSIAHDCETTLQDSAQS